MLWQVHVGWLDSLGRPIYDPLYCTTVYGIDVAEVLHTAVFRFVDSLEVKDLEVKENGSDQTQTASR